MTWGKIAGLTVCLHTDKNHYFRIVLISRRPLDAAIVNKAKHLLEAIFLIKSPLLPGLNELRNMLTLIKGAIAQVKKTIKKRGQTDIELKLSQF